MKDGATAGNRAGPPGPSDAKHGASVGARPRERRDHDVARALRVVASLPELHLRVHWFADHLEQLPLDAAASLLDSICEQANRAEPHAREALLALALHFVVLDEKEPRRSALHDYAQRERLLGLERFLRTESEPRDVERAPREAPIPNYGTGRELTVGERRSLARRPTRAQIEKLLGDPHPLVLSQLFACPKLTEADVLRVATRRPASLPAFQAMAESVRWMSRGRVRLSMLLNPSCPLSIAVPLVHVLAREDLVLVLGNTTLSAVLRTVARELLERRPPVPVADGSPTLQ